jgi:hypothetical protein
MAKMVIPKICSHEIISHLSLNLFTGLSSLVLTMSLPMAITPYAATIGPKSYDEARASCLGVLYDGPKTTTSPCSETLEPEGMLHRLQEPVVSPGNDYGGQSARDSVQPISDGMQLVSNKHLVI